MTFRILIAAALALAFTGQAAAQDEIFAITQPVALDERDAGAERVGELVYLGGVEISPGEQDIGGISGLEWHEGSLYAVSDDGHWLIIAPDEFDARLIDVLGIYRGELKDERGRRLRGKDNGDAEAITRDGANGRWIVAFEQRHRIWSYDRIDGPARAIEKPIESRLAPTQPNAGIESLAIWSGGKLSCLETYRPGTANCEVTGARNETFELAPPAELIEHGGAPTDAACLDDGTCYVLFRSYREGEGNRAAIVTYAAQSGETGTVATLLPPLTLDNFEGLAARQVDGRTYLYLVSDNNFSDNQRTLLMKFEHVAARKQVALPPPPVTEVDDAAYETVSVVLETTMGDITVALETERAPITASNFLRYVDEGRFDGTAFYRAMALDREPRPNGLIQGGTRWDPDRILPGIAHEPTTETGLSHTSGALSMAMGDPGSANGDFSIMLQDQTGLDARPGADEAVWRNGYAVFGYVTQGMDVVAAIHGATTDPDQGEGAMRGQMLAEPVEIIRARRAEAPSN